MEGKNEIVDETPSVLQPNLGNTTREILSGLDRLMKKGTLNQTLIKESLLKASRLATTFDDFRSLYLFSFFSVYPKIWPDFKWVDTLMETSIKYSNSEYQLFILLKDAALMGKHNISKKIKPRLEAVTTTN